MKTFVATSVVIAVALSSSACGRPASQAAKALSRDAAEKAAREYGTARRAVAPPRTREAPVSVRRRSAMDRAEDFAAARGEDAIQQGLEELIDDQLD